MPVGIEGLLVHGYKLFQANWHPETILWVNTNSPFGRYNNNAMSTRLLKTLSFSSQDDWYGRASFLSFLTFLVTCFSMLVIFAVTTPDTLPKETFINLKYGRTNIGKQSLSFVAIDVWKILPSSLKTLVFSRSLSRLSITYYQNNKWIYLISSVNNWACGTMKRHHCYDVITHRLRYSIIGYDIAAACGTT